MNTEISSQKNEEQKTSSASFFDVSAWFVFGVPLASALIGSIILIIAARVSISNLTLDKIQQGTTELVFLIQILNLIFGLLVCCLIRFHKRKYSVWISLLGILLSCVVGFFAFWGLVFSSMGSNC